MAGRKLTNSVFCEIIFIAISVVKYPQTTKECLN